LQYYLSSTGFYDNGVTRDDSSFCLTFFWAECTLSVTLPSERQQLPSEQSSRPEENGVSIIELGYQFHKGESSDYFNVDYFRQSNKLKRTSWHVLLISI
jgi:hypothetical protein